MADDLKYGTGGHLLHNAAGHLIYGCGSPCTACSGTQNDGTFVKTGCGCYTPPTTALYYSAFFITSGGCYWIWGNGIETAHTLIISYIAEIWSATYQLTGRPGELQFESTNLGNAITCGGGGKLSGSFAMSGVNSCVGCTATVSLP
jgi:hypothetical protein